MGSYPIWNNVTACIYKSSKSYGARDTGEVEICIGTSASNSHEFVRHVVTRRKTGDYTKFTFGVDLHDGKGLQVLKFQYMHNKSRVMLKPNVIPENLSIGEAA